MMMTYILPPEPDVAIGFFFPLLICFFNFSALSKYCMHFALILSFDLSPWASSESTVAGQQVIKLKVVNCSMSNTKQLYFSPIQ